MTFLYQLDEVDYPQRVAFAEVILQILEDEPNGN